MIHEKDKYVIPQQLESEINLAMTLQNKLLNISNETFESIYFFIRNSSFIQSNDRPRQLTNSILTAVEYRPWAIPNIALLCKKWFDQSTSTNIFLKLKSDILFKIFSQELKKQENLHFLAHCLEVNFISPQEIVEYIYQLSVDKSDKMSQLNLYFVWFAPEIEANNIALYQTLSSIFFSKSEVPDDQKTVNVDRNQNILSDAPLCCDAFYSFNQSSENNFDCGPELEDFLKNLESYKANNWSLLKQYRLNCCNHHRINLAIKDDNIDELQQIVAEQEFDLNQTSLPSIFELSSYCQTEPTLIQFAAFYGSVECFKYLYLNGADIHKTDEEKKTALHFAIAGGNFEIIRILHRAKFDLSNYAGVAVLYHRNEIFQWINDTFMIDVSKLDQQKELILESSCGSNNLEIFRFCMEKGININKKNDLGIFVIMFFIGLHYVLQYGIIELKL